ncbi:MAG TPA: hypothetical protein VMF89_25485, partial [Polyangiales bacterium]|nr:hypothetical protein [Polyangiales bacterium]
MKRNLAWILWSLAAVGCADESASSTPDAGRTVGGAQSAGTGGAKASEDAGAITPRGGAGGSGAAGGPGGAGGSGGSGGSQPAAAGRDAGSADAAAPGG